MHLPRIGCHAQSKPRPPHAGHARAGAYGSGSQQLPDDIHQYLPDDHAGLGHLCIALTAIGGPTPLHPHEQLATIRPQVTFRRGARGKGEADIHSEPTGPVEYATIEYGGLPVGANYTATQSITSDGNTASVCVLGSYQLSDEELRCTDLAMSGGDVPAIHEGLA